MSPSSQSTSSLPLRNPGLSPSVVTLARAFAVTPPPDATDSPNVVHDKCLLKIRGELDELNGRLQNLHASSPDPPHSYQSWHDAFYDELEELKTTVNRHDDMLDNLDVQGAVDKLSNKADEIEAGVYEKIDDINTRLDGMDARFDGIDARLDGIDARLDGIDARIDGIDARLDGIDARLDGINARLDRMDARFDGMDARFDGIEARQKNRLVSRFDHLVTPVTRSTGNEHLQQEVQPLKWYWKLHREDRTDKLIQLHEYYQISIRDWLRDDSSDDSEDDEDLDASVPFPSTLTEAIRLYRSRAVSVLFLHLGLEYQHFEDLERKHRRLQTPGPIKRRDSSSQGRKTKRERRADSGTTESYLGSTTQPFTSPTQSPLA